MKKENLFLTTSLVLALAINLSAQDSLKNKQLTEVVVSASRTERNIDDVGRSVTVISSDDIKKSGANSLAELLTEQEGIYVVGAGQNPGMTTSIFTRGANSNQTVILVDGVKITDPSAINNSIDLSELSLANIDRIEIIRGSHSTMYGSSAIGGVVNIITKKAKKPGLTVDVADTHGNFGKGTLEGIDNAYIGYALKNGFYISAEGLYENSKGLNATVDTITKSSTYQHPNLADNFNKWDAAAKVGYIHNKFDIYASYKYTQQLADADKSAYVDDDNYTINFHRDLYTYGANYKLNDRIKFSYTSGYSTLKRISIDDSSLIDNNNNYDKTFSRSIYTGKLLSNEFQANSNIKGLNLMLGCGANSESMTANTLYYYYNAYGFPPAYESLKTSLDSVNPHTSTANAFMHADIGGDILSEKIKAFTLSGGLRLSDNNAFGTNVTYEINPSVKIKDSGLLYATYATGYNAPSLYQLYDATRYFTWDNNYTTGLTLGNKKLNPETSKTFEIGYKQHFNNITISVAYFQTVVKNEIEYVYLWNKNVAVDSLGLNPNRDDYRGDTYLNLGTMTTEGVEIGFNSKMGEKFIVSGNLSLVSGKLTYQPSSIDTSQTGGNHVQLYSNGAFIDKEVTVLGLTRRPNTANLSITYMPIKRLALRADMRHVGSRSDVFYDSSLGPYGALNTVGVAQYTLLDLSARVNIYKGLCALARVANVFNEKYSEINGYTTRGRGIYLTLRYSF